ncbi:hypothetical protein [Telmatospirillum sp. J64-1]|uniref:hypothetical protein n=1 Tax=Telmatospirillum sp. J64-1 TaxID=2502183 RepID=UPI00115E01FC|nr:hypothetical protein [Telmatospirillum sp. J64-1]
MKEFEQAVAAAVGGMIASGKLNEIIEAKISKTIDDIVGDALRSYGDFGKSLKSAIEDSLSVDFDELGLAGYNHTVLEIVRRKVNASLLAAGKEQLEQDMEKLLTAAIPGEITITKLYQDLAEWARDYNGCEKWQRPTMIIGEPSRGWRWIYMDAKPSKDRYSCAFSLLVREDGGIASLHVEGRDIEKTLFAGSLNSFEETLFRLYAAKARVAFDADEPDDIDLSDDDF